MKFCIISDLHCKYQIDTSISSETLLFSNMQRKPVSQHPVVAMLKAIEEDETIKSDVLLCLGDLGDRADEQGITSGWAFMEEIRQKLGAKIKIGIPGNHDINSRKLNGKDALSFIKNFHEAYPTHDDNLNAKFWGDGYCIQIDNGIMFLLINTVHDHLDSGKANSSTIKPETLEAIGKEIKYLSNESIQAKICMLHHHPIKHSNINNYKDSDSLDNGDELISLLCHNAFNIVIHGHKHQPRIVEYNGLSIFATGSFSSIANLPATGFQTMFHVIEFTSDYKKGIIHSWEFNIRDGWQRNYNRKFPYKIGFGANCDLEVTAKSIYDLVSTDSMPKFYEEVLKIEPNLEFMIPERLVILGNILRDKYRLVVDPEYPLIPNKVTLLKKISHAK